MTAVAQSVAWSLNRAVEGYLAHCLRMDAWDARQRRKARLRRARRRAAWSRIRPW